MNLFGQQNDFLVQIVFLIVQYATDHGTLFFPGEELPQIIEFYCFVRRVLQSIKETSSEFSFVKRALLISCTRKKKT